MRSNRTLNYFSSFIKKIPDLSGKEKIVLIQRLKKNTLEAIGKTFELTEARIRQIEWGALKKISGKNRQLPLFKRSVDKIEI